MPAKAKEGFNHRKYIAHCSFVETGSFPSTRLRSLQTQNNHGHITFLISYSFFSLRVTGIDACLLEPKGAGGANKGFERTYGIL
jgi:hypothetical protein